MFGNHWNKFSECRAHEIARARRDVRFDLFGRLNNVVDEPESEDNEPELVDNGSEAQVNNPEPLVNELELQVNPEPQTSDPEPRENEPELRSIQLEPQDSKLELQDTDLNTHSNESVTTSIEPQSSESVTSSTESKVVSTVLNDDIINACFGMQLDTLHQEHLLRMVKAIDPKPICLIDSNGEKFFLSNEKCIDQIYNSQVTSLTPVNKKRY